MTEGKEMGLKESIEQIIYDTYEKEKYCTSSTSVMSDKIASVLVSSLTIDEEKVREIIIEHDRTSKELAKSIAEAMPVRIREGK